MGKLLRSKLLTFTLVMSITAVFVARIHQQQGSLCGPRGPGQIIAFQIDLNHLPAGVWAGPGALEAAKQLGVLNCIQTNTMVGAALYLGLHLLHNPDDNAFNLWAADTPPSLKNTYGGVVQCVSFVMSVYQMAFADKVPYARNAGDWWFDYQHAPGFTEIAATPNGGLPQPGDFIVSWDSNRPPDDKHKLFPGHIAVVIGVQPPQGTQDGYLLSANANAPWVLSKWPIRPDFTIGSYWKSGGILQTVKGYIRLTSSQG
jgi:hypothetical protein